MGDQEHCMWLQRGGKGGTGRSSMDSTCDIKRIPTLTVRAQLHWNRIFRWQGRKLLVWRLRCCRKVGDARQRCLVARIIIVFIRNGGYKDGGGRERERERENVNCSQT